MKPEVETIQAIESAIRVDKYLAGKYPDLSRSYLKKLVERGCILVNGYAVKASHKLNIGDEISICLPPPEPTFPTAEHLPIHIVYEDEDLIVVNKEAGITVHPAPGHTRHTLVNALLAHCPGLADFTDSMRPGIVHRLDKDTSGLIIIAKNASSHQNLINQFKTRSVTKVYLVLVKGKLTPSRGIIEAPIGRDPSNRKRMAVIDGGRPARTGYLVKEYFNGYTFLEVTLETGRTHQIRVHLSAIGYPVVGDHVYGIKSSFCRRQFVHAYRLGFHLPSDGKYQQFSADLPADLKEALRQLDPGYNPVFI